MTKQYFVAQYSTASSMQLKQPKRNKNSRVTNSGMHNKLHNNRYITMMQQKKSIKR